MRYIRYVFLGVLAVLLIAVALANRNMVTLSLLPEEMAALLQFQWSVSVPLFIVFFGGILVGLMIGFVWEWLREHKHRAEARARKAEARRLERELKRTQAERDKDKDEVLAILDQSA
ncbi:lipopolysaccharide assembly protein LapA domain-containing protein [Salipiger mucosus]|uniref:Phosphate transport regulator n=1 Tax=Salipiger mucosus DSM 16094 TaxID=1123237 RepID=S9QJE1_9RHOB|nr:lipopolysaccharide assembly protein LapA domain-containing protein [Salipiger mucosus]EPX79693.1 Phosphate transport regulator [Salipiger mucosus DSM 16094]